MKKIRLKTNCFLLLVVALICLSSCSEKYYEYKNICNLNYGMFYDDFRVDSFIRDSSMYVVTNYQSKKKEPILFPAFEMIDNVILNQYYIKNYDKIMMDFKRCKENILDENDMDEKNIFYKKQKKSFGKAIANRGLTSRFYKRNVRFNDIGKMLESEFPNNRTNYTLSLENISSCIFENDSLNLTQLPKSKKIQWSNISYDKKVKLLIYKVNVKEKPYNYVTYLQGSTFGKVYSESTFYLALGQYSFGASGGDHYYSVFFLEPQFINYKYTIKNLSRSFVNFNTNNPFSYIPYIKMYICGKYSNKIMESSCDNAINSPQLKYIKSRNKCHYYAFYSEIYKKDMLVKLNTKHPEKIKVRDYVK